MKLNTFLIILLFILKQISAECYEPVGLSPKTLRKVACGKWTTQEKNINNNDVNKLVEEGNDTMFQIKVTCSVNDEKCDKAKKAFYGGGKTISNTLRLKEKITVNAKFCVGKSDSCPVGDRVIGITLPNKLYSLLSDDDKLERIYPQALVKQFQFPRHPQYDDFDISIFINAGIDFHFTDDITPINPSQYDIEFTITHELLHGLGFYSFWGPYYYDSSAAQALWPVISGNDEKMDFVTPTDLTGPVIRLDNGTFITEYT